MVNPKVIFASLVLLHPNVIPARAEVIYQNDFQGAVGSEWSNTSTSITPAGSRTFLGPFRSQAVTLTLNAIPNHGLISATFDLFVIGSWDGVEPTDGPDIFDVGVTGGPTLLHTTFSNVDNNSFSTYVQSYPNSFPGPTHPDKTGATEANSLGYASIGSIWGDAVYHASLSVPHAENSLQLRFSASLTDPGVVGDPNREVWGLDNVRIDANPIPEPSTLLFVGMIVAMFSMTRLGRGAPILV